MKLLSVFLLLWLWTQGFAQQNQDPATQEFTATELQEEFDLVVQSLHEAHPALERFVLADSLKAIESEYRSLLNEGMTSEAFHILVRQYIAHLRCGHTTALPSSDWYAFQRNESKILPVNVWVEGNKLYVREGENDNSLLQSGAELLSIDQKPAADILADMYSIQERDGLTMTFVRSKVERLFKTYYLFLYGRQDSYQLKVLNPDGNQVTVTVEAGKNNPPVSQKVALSRKGEIKTSTATFYLSEEAPGLAVLDINSFSRQGFRQFYEEAFASIEENGITHLVLDLRNNGGGYFPNGNKLLTYFLEEEVVMKFHRRTNKVSKLPGLNMDFTSKMTVLAFNLMPDYDETDPMRNHEIRFKPRKENQYQGNLYVLTNGGTFSMGSLVATQLSHHTDALLIGEETGGGEEGSNAILLYTLELPTTGIRVSIPHYTVNHDVLVSEKGRGVMPDINIPYSVSEKFSGIDKEMERVMALVKGE